MAENNEPNSGVTWGQILAILFGLLLMYLGGYQEYLLWTQNSAPVVDKLFPAVGLAILFGLGLILVIKNKDLDFLQ
jgi:hypothetical protein